MDGVPDWKQVLTSPMSLYGSVRRGLLQRVLQECRIQRNGDCLRLRTYSLHRVIDSWLRHSGVVRRKLGREQFVNDLKDAREFVLGNHFTNAVLLRDGGELWRVVNRE